MTEQYDKKSARFLAEKGIHTEWESNYLNPDIDRFYDLAFPKIADALGAEPGAKLLDAGCGYCVHTVRLAKKGFQITAVDFSNSALDRARETIAAAGLADRVQLRRADLTELPFADGEFDCVVCWGVIMHIPEMQQALRELTRVLKPGGRLAIGENNRFSLHALCWENALRFVKRLLGRSVPKRRYLAHGVEDWTESESGGLMVRKTDMPYLKNLCRTFGLQQIMRFAGQFTEIYTSVPWRSLKRLIHGLNVVYFRYVGLPGPALGNIVIFEKMPRVR
jgi:ubiquinone/menaquinone biosynthesis C-methylase UbiE